MSNSPTLLKLLNLLPHLSSLQLYLSPATLLIKIKWQLGKLFYRLLVSYWHALISCRSVANKIFDKRVATVPCKQLVRPAMPIDPWWIVLGQLEWREILCKSSCNERSIHSKEGRSWLSWKDHAGNALVSGDSEGEENSLPSKRGWLGLGKKVKNTKKVNTKRLREMLWSHLVDKNVLDRLTQQYIQYRSPFIKGQLALTKRAR